MTAGQTDGISVSYEYTDAVVVVASASIMFNIGEISFDSSSASAGGSAVVSLTQRRRKHKQCRNTNIIGITVFSDSDSGGLIFDLVTRLTKIQECSKERYSLPLTRQLLVQTFVSLKATQ